MTSIRVPLGRLFPDPANRPDGSGAAGLEELAQTIRILGVLQPPIVEPIPGRQGCYRIKDGHRRYAAAELAGLEEMDVEVRRFGHQAPEVTGALTAIVTTLHRSPHGAVELALRFAALTNGGMTPNEIIRVTALPPSTVYGYLKLAKADRRTLEAARRGDLPIGAVRAAISTAEHMQPGDAPAPVRRPRTATGGRKPKPPVHFGAAHPLATRARALCLRLRHPARNQLGRVACGPCFEVVIREDAINGGGRPLHPPGDDPVLDERGPGPDADLSELCGPVHGR